jgi:hypothetical protein
MHKLYTVICFVLLSATALFSQAFIDIPLSASDGSATIQLAVGLDETATDCLDPALGESDLPPFPPAGVFEFRFDLEPYCGEALSSYKDYRNAPSFPFSDTVQHRMIWQRSASGLDVNIDYDLPMSSSMVIQDEFGGVILDIGPFSGTGTATIPGSVALSSAFLYMIYDNIVPVELTSFSAIASGEAVVLNWTTATETNNKGFAVERIDNSLNQEWQQIAFVGGNGTTTQPHSYTYTDNDVDQGVYVYRLKQVDFNGSTSYSKEVEVSVGSGLQDYGLFQNYPNPFNPTTSIRFQVPVKSDVTIKIYDMLGQEIRTLFSGEVNQGQYTVTWDGLNSNGSKMSSGNYIYRMKAGDFVQTKQMILLK